MVISLGLETAWALVAGIAIGAVSLASPNRRCWMAPPCHRRCASQSSR
jgi:hypothetical protein